MTQSRLFCLLLLAGCASAPPPAPQPAPPPEPETVVAEPVELVDPCADFEASRLDAGEHQRQYGCPPCPCSCVDGEVVCAPCLPCEAYGPGPDPVTIVPPSAP